MNFRTILVVALAVVMVSSKTPSAAQCLGDFNGDFNVTVAAPGSAGGSPAVRA